MSSESKLAWQALCIDKKKRQEARIPVEWRMDPLPEDRTNVIEVPRECRILSSKELLITETEVQLLLDKVKSGEWSAVEVTLAFYKRAIVAHQLTNCLTEIFVEKALARAKELDEYLKTTGIPMGPFHGLPISIKDQIQIKGLETTMGYASWIGNIADEDSTIVTIFYQLGAVPFVRTNLPQTVLFLETHNHVFGRTSNPHNLTLTPGGSSGGEGALIALKGSPLGVGSDLGGSIRVPSAFCGVYGLRPSNHRIPYRGVKISMDGQESIASSLGPISSSISGLKLFMKGILSAQPWKRDPMSLRMPWNAEGYDLVEHGNGKQLCFGIMWDDGYTLPLPPVRRALDMVTQAILDAGHKIIPWKPHKHSDIVKNAMSIYFAGGAGDLAATFAESGETLIQSMRPDTAIGPDKLPPYWPDNLPSPSAYELWRCHTSRRTLREEYMDYWMATITETGTGRPLDALIAPVAPCAAPPHGDARNTPYGVIWSTLDYPALAFPVTTVDPILDAPVPRAEFLSKEDELLYEIYHPELHKDAPVGLQIVARTHEDEALIRMAEIVDEALKSALFARKREGSHPGSATSHA